MHEQTAEVAHGRHRSISPEIIARLGQDLLQEGALQNSPGARLDSPELSLRERELLQRFRQPTHRQQNTLVTLIAYGMELAQA